VDLARLLAESVQQLRREAGLTQIEMARRLGISQPTLNRIESSAHNVKLETLTKLCQALQCDPCDLFRPGSLRFQRRRRAVSQRR
jgi:transcriptional regulator with XRE-family HTH domain